MPSRFEPIVNGHRYSYASVDLIINGKTYVGAKRVNYSSSLEPGIIYSDDPGKFGRTPGKASHSCELELYRLEWNDLVVALGQSFGRKAFNVQVQYAEDGEPVTTDAILGCRITKVEFQNSEGTEASSVVLTLDPMDIRLGKENLSIEFIDWEEAAA
jgi:hypothetical protein